MSNEPIAESDIPEKPKQAVAIVYDQNVDNAPRISAKGAGFVADNIIKLGLQHSVPIYQNKTLASMLMALEIDHEIPPELYKVIAEVLAYIYRLDQRIGHREK